MLQQPLSKANCVVKDCNSDIKKCDAECRFTYFTKLS